ncbi:MAG TPA: 2-C-methyl-D-erythritol 4-phosphate cytidylyltransferase [Gemmatales bacterium]|nr:2-C-methyl-D-erythritol 4-phosphate cytidylyltransferase [Gemmatales bacterium]
MAAGRSQRFDHDVKKPYADIDGRAVWMRAADVFIKRQDVVQTILVVAAEDEENVQRRYGPNMAFMNVQLVLGGKERSDSVAQGLAAVQPDIDFVAIHDAARPCLTDVMVEKVFALAIELGAAILAAPVVDTLKRADKQLQITRTEDRTDLWLAQTPQVFRRDIILKAYQSKPDASATDDSVLVETLGYPVAICKGDHTNIKITTLSDLFLAEAIVKSRPKPKSKAFHPFADEAMWK